MSVSREARTATSSPHLPRLVAPCSKRTRCSPGSAVGLLDRSPWEQPEPRRLPRQLQPSPSARGLDLQANSGSVYRLREPGRDKELKWFLSWARGCYITPTGGAGAARSGADAGRRLAARRGTGGGGACQFLAAQLSFSLQLKGAILPGGSRSARPPGALCSQVAGL